MTLTPAPVGDNNCTTEKFYRTCLVENFNDNPRWLSWAGHNASAPPHLMDNMRLAPK
jgi:hypothetical protein